MRSRSQFPKADADTLLKLYGKDRSKAKKTLDFAPARFAAIDFDVTNGIVTVSPSTVEETIKNNTRYTLSHKQNQAFTFSKQLCELYNNALTDGMVNRDDTNSVRNVLKKFVEVSPDGETLTPAVKRIATLRYCFLLSCAYTATTIKTIINESIWLFFILCCFLVKRIKFRKSYSLQQIILCCRE